MSQSKSRAPARSTDPKPPRPAGPDAPLGGDSRATPTSGAPPASASPAATFAPPASLSRSAPASEARPTPDPRPLDARPIPWTLLALTSLLILIPAHGYLTPYTPLGDDFSSHITTIATLANRIANGDGWWSTDYNLGFPLALYYQPLPHVLSALVCLLLGGPDAAPETLKLLTVVVLVVQPWAIYHGLRRAGAEPLEAALAGVFAPLLLNPDQTFGYTTHASLKVGLYTQAWGNVALPLAVGELVAMCRGRSSFLAAVAACAFVASTHMFYAIALVPPIFLCALLLPPRADATWSARSLLLPRALAFGRLATVGAGTFGVLAAWLIPLQLTQSYFGGWPFGRPDRANGFGTELLTRLRDGEFLDGTGTIATIAECAQGGCLLPVITVCAGLGLLGGLLRATRDRAAVPILVVTLFAVLGGVGRAGIGEYIDLYPMHRNVQLFRYASFVQFAMMIAAGYGLALAAHEVSRWLRAAPRAWALAIPLLLIGAVLAVPAIRGANQLYVGYRTIDDSSYLRVSAWEQLGGWLRELPEQGRFYVGRRSGVEGHYHSGLLAWAGQRPASQSYGVGLHDSLHFYTLEFFNPENADATVLAELYDLRYIVSDPDTEIAGIRRTELHRNSRYALSRVDIPDEAVAIFREGPHVTGTPRAVRNAIRRWLNGNGPAVHTTVVLDVSDDRSQSDLVGAPTTVHERQDFDDTAPPSGRVLASEHIADSVTATVELDEPALLVAKVGFHPFWRVWLDGIEQPTLFAFPGYFSVRADAGRHEFRAEYGWPVWSHVLLALAPLWLAGAWLLDRRLGRASATPERKGGGAGATRAGESSVGR